MNRAHFLRNEKERETTTDNSQDFWQLKQSLLDFEPVPEWKGRPKILHLCKLEGVYYMKIGFELLQWNFDVLYFS